MIDLAPIIQAVRLAAVLCREVQRHHIISSEKGGQGPVTIADYGAQAILCRAIKQAFPHDAIIAEESGTQFAELVAPEQRQQIAQLVGGVLGESTDETEIIEWLEYASGGTSARQWLIDPVDGTKGFLALRHYVIAVGLLEESQPTAAVIGAPAFTIDDPKGAIFYASDGEAYLQSMSQRNPPRRIYASERSDSLTLRALESVEKGHASHEQMAKVRARLGMDPNMIERIDSQEKYARIAAGEGELYLRLPRRSGGEYQAWDHAPGAALVLAAGGKVTDIDGSPLDFTKGRVLNNQGVIVTNGRFHDQAIEAVQQILREE